MEMRTVPDSVVDLRDFHITDLEFVESLIDQLGVGIALRLRRADEFERTVEAETRRRPRWKVRNSSVRYCVCALPFT